MTVTDDVERRIARDLEPPLLPDVVDETLAPGVYRTLEGGLLVVEEYAAPRFPLDIVDVIREAGTLMVCVGGEVMSAARDLDDATAIISEIAGVPVRLQPADAGDGVPRWRPELA